MPPGFKVSNYLVEKNPLMMEAQGNIIIYPYYNWVRGIKPIIGIEAPKGRDLWERRHKIGVKCWHIMAMNRMTWISERDYKNNAILCKYLHYWALQGLLT